MMIFSHYSVTGNGQWNGFDAARWENGHLNAEYNGLPRNGGGNALEEATFQIKVLAALLSDQHQMENGNNQSLEGSSNGQWDLMEDETHVPNPPNELPEITADDVDKQIEDFPDDNGLLDAAYGYDPIGDQGHMFEDETVRLMHHEENMEILRAYTAANRSTFVVDYDKAPKHKEEYRKMTEREELKVNDLVATIDWDDPCHDEEI